ncbi:MAG TPA: hypothetical protein VG796_14315 [Verrucomicrobiales bacterium]|nr:hypothetical protein [Verrucomicrobiales bacterium]
MLWDALDAFDDNGTWLVDLDRCLLHDCALRYYLREDGIMGERPYGPKVPDPTLNVAAPTGDSGEVSLMQKAALDDLVANAQAYEARILTYFDAVAQRVAATAMNGDFDEVRTWVAANPGCPLPALKDQLILEDINLHSDGWDGIGCISFDFDCGWEEEHGVSLLMHTARVIAEGGRAEFACGDQALERARHAQKWQTGFDIPLS